MDCCSALRDNQVDGEKYFLYAYSLSNYESLGEAYLFDWRGSRYGYENVTSKVNAGCFKLLPRLIRQIFAIFFGIESSSKGLYQSSGKEKESFCPLFPSSTKREIRHNNVVVGKEMYKKLGCTCKVGFANLRASSHEPGYLDAVLPWVHSRNFIPRGQRSWEGILGPNSRKKENMAKYKNFNFGYHSFGNS